MAIRVLMVDVDGVVVVPDRHVWSANLDRDLGLSRDTLQAEFFARTFTTSFMDGRACAIGSGPCCSSTRLT